MPSLWWNVGMCFLMGAAAGGMLPVTYALLAETMPSKQRGWALVLVGGLGAVGGYLAASALSAWLQPIFGWRILWFLNLPTGLILIFLNAYVPESPKFLLAIGRVAEAHAVLRNFGCTVRDVGVAAVEKVESTLATVAHLPQSYVARTWALSIAAIAWGLINFGLLLWMPALLVATGSGRVQGAGGVPRCRRRPTGPRPARPPRAWRNAGAPPATRPRRSSRPGIGRHRDVPRRSFLPGRSRLPDPEVAPVPRCLPALATALALAAACGGVQAASVSVFVSDPAGKPLLDAVVMLEPATGKLPVAPMAGVQIAQVKRQFAPQVSVVTVGTPVTFPNDDTVRHHVYSFSPVKTFELKLYAGVPNAPVVFDKPGIAVLGCNIHDQMVAWVVVVDTPLLRPQRRLGQGADRRRAGRQLPAAGLAFVARRGRAADLERAHRRQRRRRAAGRAQHRRAGR